MREIEGDLWDWQGRAVIAITTNGMTDRKGRAILGRGCAAQAKEKYADLPGILGNMLSRFGNHVHFLGRGMVSFPVEHTPFENPDLRLIEQSARELVAMADREGWELVVLPRPGCGGGGMSWREVGPLLARHLDDRFLLISLEKCGQ